MTVLSLLQISELVKEITPLGVGKRFLEIGLLSKRKFILKLQDLPIVISLNDPFLYFHLSKGFKSYSTQFFLDQINKTLKESLLTDLKTLNDDKILQFNFINKKGSYFLIVELFSKKANLYLVNDHYEIITSMVDSSKKQYRIPEKSNRLIPNENELSSLKQMNSESVEKFYRTKELDYEFHLEKRKIQKEIEQELKKTRKSIQNTNEALKKCLNYEEKFHQAILLQNSFSKLKKGQKEILVHDFKNEQDLTIYLDPKLHPKDQLASFFKQAKKLKLGIEHQKRRLVELEKKLEFWQVKQGLLTDLNDLKSLKFHFKQEDQVKKEEKKQLPYKEFISNSGLKILVGKSSRDNDRLTFQYAKGNDLWLHVKDWPGSHVVIVKPKGTVIDPSTIEQAARLACLYSKAKNETKADVCLTEKKYVSRLKNLRNGQVLISKHQTIQVKINPHSQ